MTFTMNVVSVIYLLFNLFAINCTPHPRGNRSAEYVYKNENDGDIETFMPHNNKQDTRNKFTTTFSNRYQGDQNLCPGRTFCTALSDCRLLLDLMDRSCLVASRLKDLTCGYVKNEVMICCPSGGQSSPFKPGYQEDDDPNEPDRPGSGETLNQACGRPQLNGWQSGYSGLGSQPWVARIGFKNSDTGATEYPCIGSIISRKCVLTAAHCALAKSSGRTISTVRIGEYDMRTDPDCTNNFCAHAVQNVPIASVVVHPGYEKSIFRHDVALIILKTAVNYSLAVQPICLLQNPNVPLVGRKGILVGFGKLPDEDVASPRQHQLQLPIVSLDVCSRIYDQVVKITSNNLCVGGEPKKDACSGFGGAPLVILDPMRQDKFYQVGLMSFGSDKCGAGGVPSVYISIQEYFTWIRSNIPSN